MKITKKNTRIGIIGTILSFSTFVFAEMPFTNRSELVGTWSLEATSTKIDGVKNPEQGTWAFEADGKLTVTSFYSFAPSFGGKGNAATLEDKFDVADGKLVTGLKGKLERLELNGNQMILKGPEGIFYHFKKNP